MNTTPTPERMTRPLQMVFIKRPRCPRCGGTDFQTLRSVADQGDGSTLRRTRCRTCSHRFDLVLE